MRYYYVYVAEVSYQKSEPLTYAYPEALAAGTVVVVPFGRKRVAGFVQAETTEPSFKTKEITDVISSVPLPPPLRELHRWMGEYYPSGSGALTQLFVPSLLTVKPRAQAEKPAVPSAALPPLTPEQRAVVNTINSSEKRAFLLHGETGSGKTRVYQEFMARSLSEGKSVLMLTPEISLLPQLEAELAKQFGNQVVVLHSNLTNATRARRWRRVLESQTPLLVLGTRSALFSPLHNIGLVIVDEMHEPAYKQESAPRYYGLRVAAQTAKLHGASIIYGSATPPVTEYFVAAETHTPILRMAKTARPAGEVKRSLIDLKDKSLFSRHPSLSNPLLTAIEHRLNSGEQTLLFLNRRGTARTILCQACGWQALCPHCDIPLTYHGDNHTMRCHICAFRSHPPYHCPECGSDDIVYRSPGTKALADSLQHLFPQALTQRFDTDNLVAEQLGKHFADVRAGKVDILVGTQMLGKGLDLPGLSLVGIVNADTSLGIPDFSSAERSYQLLHQAIGRVGRGHRAGEVIVQSFNPGNLLLKAALEQDWHRLYQQELAERKAFGFPPYMFLLKLSVSRRTSVAAETFALKLYQAVVRSGLRIQANEPTPGFYEKTHGRYHWQIVIRAKQRGQLVELVGQLPPGDWSYDLDPINLL